MTDSAQPMIVDMGAPNFMRYLFIAVGACIIGLTVWELGPLFWPPNMFSWFFLIIILGAGSVGGPMLKSAIFGMNERWTVEKGRLTVDRSNWFNTEKLIFSADDIVQFNLAEFPAMEGENTWKVIIWVSGWQKFESYHVSSKRGAEKLRDEIRAALGGEPVSE